MPKKQRNTLWWRTLQFLTVLVIVTIAMLVGATWLPCNSVRAMLVQIVREPSSPQKSTPNAQIATPTGSVVDLSKLAKDVESQNATFSAEKDELDYLTRVIVLMMTAIGIYTIILGFVSWKALDSQKEAFERSAQDALANIENLRNELQLDFPMLGRIQRNFKGILATLRIACQSLEVRDDSFSSLRLCA